MININSRYILCTNINIINIYDQNIVQEKNGTD